MQSGILKKRVDVALKRCEADLVIKNAKVVDVYNEQIIEGDIAISDGVIVGVGSYSGKEEIDAKGKYASPGFIDGHIHIESAHVSPEEMGRVCVPHGTTSIIADPHEIVNVGGIPAMKYMLDSSNNTALDIKYMLPSCVPATPFENAGAVVDAKAMEEVIDDDRILGLGEFMNYPGILNNADSDIDKLVLCHNKNKIIDGHSPALGGDELNAYASVGVHDDHECSSVEELKDRIQRGMYVILREGTACHDLETLLKGVNEKNARRCILCSDDRMPNTILTKGHLEGHLRMCVKSGLKPITAIQMASLNAAECFNLNDRGSITPGKRADIVLFDSLETFNVDEVIIEGKLVAKSGKYLLDTKRYDYSSVKAKFDVKGLNRDSFRLQLKSDDVWAIELVPGGVLTKKTKIKVERDENGDFVYNEKNDIVKVAVIERHHGTGNISIGLLKGYGIKKGAIAVSFAHDSHNIIVAGVTDDDIYSAVSALIEQGGGIAVSVDGKGRHGVPMPIGGIMSDLTAEEVVKQLEEIDKTAYEELGVDKKYDPLTTLSFMALPVIPSLKLTDKGLFDVEKFDFINIEVE